MPVAIGRAPAGKIASMELLEKFYWVLSAEKAFGVTINLPSWLIQWA